LIRVLADITSAAYLRGTSSSLALPNTTLNRDSSTPFARDPNALREVSDILSRAARDGLPWSAFSVYAWVVFAHQLPSSPAGISLGDQEFLSSQLLEELALLALDNFKVLEWIQTLMLEIRRQYKGSADSGLEDSIRELVLGMLSYSVDVGFVLYGSDIFATFMAALDADRPYLEPIDTRLFSRIHPLQIMTHLIQPFLSNAQSRFPYETLPFVRLIRSLFLLGLPGHKTSLPVFDYITTLNEFTELLPLSFEDYEQVDEDYPHSDSYFVILKNDLPILITRSPRNHGNNANAHNSMALIPIQNVDWQVTTFVPAGSQGEVRSNEKPLVVTWTTEFRPICYLVDCLSTAAPGNNKTLFSKADILPPEDIIEMIKLLATALQTAHQDAVADGLPPVDAAQDILKIRPGEMDHEQDIITTIFEIFEYTLQRQKVDKDLTISTEILTACMEFFHATTYFAPNRIWPILVRSRLLDLNGCEPALITVVSNSEILRGDFSFLLRSIKLFDALIDLAYTQPQTKNTSMKRALSRLASTTSTIQFAVPPKTIRTIMNVYLDVLVHAFQDCQFWRFTDQNQLTTMNTSILTAFNKILTVTYGFDEEFVLERKFSSTLADCAKSLLDLLLAPESSTSTIVNTIVGLISKPFPPTALGSEPILSAGLSSSAQHKDQVAEVRTALELCNTVLHLAIHTNCDASLLEARLFKAAPTLTRLYAMSYKLRTPISITMNLLLAASMRHDTVPPSLLGHMGADMAKAFLLMLSQLAQPLEDIDREVATWNLMSKVVNSQQQWFALYLLTGRAPRETGCKTSATNETVLNFALDKLSSISKLPWEKLKVPIAMLQFVSISYSKWRITNKTIREHQTFLPAIIEYFAKLRREDRPALAQITETQVASLIAEILTMHLYYCREMGDFKFASTLVNKLGYFKNFGFLPPVLNTNQQSFLRKNLKGMYPGFQLSKVKHSTIFPVEYGRNYFYDCEMAMKLIESVKGHGDHKGFALEIQWANINLSELDVQVNLHKQCKLLATELAQVAAKDPSYALVDPLLDVVHACCIDMRNTSLPDGMADKFQKSQIELVAIILQRLVVIKHEQIMDELIGVFHDIWNAFCNTVQNFDAMYTGIRKDINRTFLQILFLSLQLMSRSRATMNGKKSAGKHIPPKYFTELLTIASDIVPKGFKSLAELAHNEMTARTVQVTDFVLLTSIFQTILKIPGIEAVQTQLALNLANSEISRYAINLFTWSDQLLIDGDPVFGEVSILFLLELSSVPAMADSLAAQGILSQLSGANLMALYNRPAGIGPFDKPARLHSVWARGILPLCLNLLDAVGPPVVAEIVAFLAQYPHQAERLIKQLGNRRGDMGTRPGQSHMTLAMAAEAHSMALLSAIVDGLRSAGGMAGNIPAAEIPALPWDRAALKEEIEDWVAQKDGLRRYVIPAGDHEAEMYRAKATRPEYEDRLEERVWAELKGASECLSGNGA
jgi:nuclear pore complex protein Nup188